MSVVFAMLFLVVSASAGAVVEYFVVWILSVNRKGIWHERLPDVYRRLVLAFGIRLVSTLTLYDSIN